MEIEQALVTYLLAQSGLTAYIGNRLYPEEAEQKVNIGSFPIVLYMKISDVKGHTLTAQMKQEKPYFEFSAMAKTKSEARNIINEIRTALVDYQGTLSGLVIQKVELQNENSLKERSTDGTVQLYTETLEFQIFFERS